MRSTAGESIWATKTNVVPRYIQRHFLRVQWMRWGFEAMGLLRAV